MAFPERFARERIDLFNTGDHLRRMTLTAVLTPAEEGGFVALNPETGTTSQGETLDEALSNLREATELFLEEFPLPRTGNAILTTFQVTAGA